MNPTAIYSKSGKGVQEAAGKTSLLQRPDRAVLSAIDGRATLADVAQKVGKPFDAAFQALITTLNKAREEAEAKAQAERDRVKKEAEAKMRAEMEAQMRAEAEKKAKEEAEAKAKATTAAAEAQVKAAKEAALKAAEAKVKVEQE